ncbi:hypothetical protein [Brachybacterium squillarum]|uniref:hypothetical protein n=1 Tax=Brachybacterium squillarum TaxID=661979 RepID=UPI00222140AD|nr:hypothetical protein [Brachybacterium squillarum]MCW1804243.1 hypothetical protein [Brachybacterium squillarum]
MTAPERAPLGAALALLISLVALTGPLSPVLMAVVAGGLALLLGAAWPDLLELPSPRGTRIVVAGSGIAGAALTVLAPERLTPVTSLLVVTAVGVFASFGHQMLRSDRHDLTSSLTGTVAGVLLAAVASCWPIAQEISTAGGGSLLVTAIATGLAATLLLDATSLPVLPRTLLAVLAGTGITALLAVQLGAMAALPAVGLGALVAVAASCTHLLLGSSLVAREPVAALGVAAGPVATAGVIAHLAAAMLT